MGPKEEEMIRLAEPIVGQADNQRFQINKPDANASIPTFEKNDAAPIGAYVLVEHRAVLM